MLPRTVQVSFCVPHERLLEVSRPLLRSLWRPRGAPGGPREIALFVVSAVVLAVLCSRVADWAVMTDELLYERLSLSFVDGAFLPTLHGEHVDVYAVSTRSCSCRSSRSSTCRTRCGRARPERRALRERRDPDVAARPRARAAAFAALRPRLRGRAAWTVIGGFVMTEAAAYPASLLGAVLAIHRAVVLPSLPATSLALGAILSRRSRAAARRARRRLRPRRRRAGGALRPLARAPRALGVAALAVSSSRSAARAPAATRRRSRRGAPLARRAPLGDRAPRRHAVAIGIVPLLLGGGWAIVALVRRLPSRNLAFAGIVVAAVTVLAVESGSVVTRFGLGLDVKDRYFFYVAPLLFLATACALEDPRPRLVAGVLAVTALFVLTVGLEEFEPVFGVNVDSPASATHEALTSYGATSGSTCRAARDRRRPARAALFSRCAGCRVAVAPTVSPPSSRSCRGDRVHVEPAARQLGPERPCAHRDAGAQLSWIDARGRTGRWDARLLVRPGLVPERGRLVGRRVLERPRRPRPTSLDGRTSPTRPRRSRAERAHRPRTGRSWARRAGLHRAHAARCPLRPARQAVATAPHLELVDLDQPPRARVDHARSRPRRLDAPGGRRSGSSAGRRATVTLTVTRPTSRRRARCGSAAPFALGSDGDARARSRSASPRAVRRRSDPRRRLDLDRARDPDRTSVQRAVSGGRRAPRASARLQRVGPAKRRLSAWPARRRTRRSRLSSGTRRSSARR